MKKNLLKHPGFVYSVCTLIFIAAITPVWCFQYFPTVDGPAHFYNASIIRELLLGDKEIYSPFFKFNPQPVPNWTGHLLAVILGIFFPVWIVEKIIVLLIVVGIPYGIFRLLKNLSVTPSWNILLVLPFTHSLIVYLGFFNFLFSVNLMIVAFAWIVKWNMPGNAIYILKVTILLTLIYFSHILAFGLTLIFTGMVMIWNQWIYRDSNIFSKVNFQKILCFVPGLILSVWFFSTRSVNGFRNELELLPFEELWKMLRVGAPLVGLNESIETPYTSIFVAGLGVLLLFNLFWRIKNRIKFETADLLIVFSLLLLVMFFIIPNGMVSGGFISLRILLIVLLCTVIWLNAQKSPQWIIVLSGALGVFVSFSTLSYRLNTATQLNGNAINVINLVQDVEPGSVLLPLNYSGNWLHSNISNYAGATRKIIILDNYEAVWDVFPLQWKTGQAPELLAGNFAQSTNPEIEIDKYEQATGNKIDYVTRWQYYESTQDSISLATDKILRNHFTQKVEVGEGDLFFNEEIVSSND